MTRQVPIWRSMLFVPAHVDKFVSAAHTRGADAYILDLEDSVPPALKSKARELLASAVAKVSRSGASVIIRVNAEAGLLSDDLKCSVICGVHALMVPKVSRGEELRAIDAQISKLEENCDLPMGEILVIAQIESVHALPYLDEIATSSTRLLGLILGSEDFSVSAGMRPTLDTLYGPNQQLVFACRRAGILPFGFPGSIASFREEEHLRVLISRARDMGFVGSYAIHPNQVTVMNELFLPSETEIKSAREMLAGWEHAVTQGRGAFEHRGRMIDPPVIAQAQEILRRHTIASSKPPKSSV